MKYKPLVLTFLCTSLLFGCSKDDTKKESIAKENKETQTSKKTATKSETLKNVERFTGVIKDKEGKEYELKIKPVKEEKTVVKSQYASTAQGDTLYSGDYNLVLLSKGKEKQKIKLSNLTINKDTALIKVIDGKRDLLLVGQSEASNTNWGYIFLLKDEKLVKVKNVTDKSDTLLFTETSVKEVQPYFYQTAFYDNTEAKWIYTMYKLDEKNNTLTATNKEMYNYKDGANYYNSNFVHKQSTKLTETDEK